ncbi:MAG: hypothetical protein AAF752_02135 [Bacteroidota bacterium]
MRLPVLLGAVLLLALPASAQVSVARQLGFSDVVDQDAVQAVYHGPDGKTYTCGAFTGIAEFGTNPVSSLGRTFSSNGSQDGFYAVYDANGFVDSETLGHTNQDIGCNVIRSDAAGTVYVGGSHAEQLAIGSTVYPSDGSGTGGNGYVASIQANGTVNWVKRLVGPGSLDAVTGLVVDTGGNVTVTGYFNGSTLDIDGLTLVNSSSNGTFDAFVASYTSTGSLRWGFAFGGSDFDIAYDIEFDADAGLFQTGYLVAGSFRGTVDFDPTSGSDVRTTPLGNSDGYVLRLFDTGSGVSYAGTFQLGGNQDDEIRSIASTLGRLHIGGFFRDQVNFNPNGVIAANVTAQGALDGFVAQYSTGRNLQWVVQLGNATSGDVQDIAVAPGSGNVYAVGTFSGTVDFDAGAGVTTRTSTTANTADGFIAQYSSAGAFGFVRTIGSADNVEPNAVALSSTEVHVGGSFQGTASVEGATLPDMVNKTALESDGFLTTLRLSTAAVAPKALLGGAYFQNGAMTVGLNSNAAIPSTQPFNSAPWNYTGTESTSTIPAGVVDWVLVCLRSGPSASTTVGCRAGFISFDGKIRQTDAQTPLDFSPAAAGDYHVVVYHRNHAAVMSASKQTLNESGPVYDFTSSGTAAFGTNGQIEIESGVWALWPGDADSDGAITGKDALVIRSAQNQTGYRLGDVTMDADVNLEDLLDVWIVANGGSSNVPD